MMTREDMMRELELLPVWKLRSPLLTATVVSSQVQEAVAEQVITHSAALLNERISNEAVEPDLVEVAPASDVTVEPTSTSHELTYISSDDGDWLFVMSSSVMSNEEQQLFQNICKAIRIKTKPAETSTNSQMLISSVPSKLLLALGEVAAQTLLLSIEPIEALRGQRYQLQGVTLIATYDLAYLLKTPADKAKAWSDLCMGLQVLQDLEATNN